jgi:hypothetical protein
VAYFYEIRSADNAVLKRDGGFPTQDAAKIAGRELAKKMRNSRQPNRAGGAPSETVLTFRVAAPSRFSKGRWG